MLAGLQAKLAIVGTALVGLAALILRMNYLKNQNKRLKVVRDTLVARQKAEATKKRLIKEEKKILVSREVDIINELKKSDEEFTGIKSLGEGTDDF